MHLRLFMRVLAGAAVLVAAGLRAPAAESAGQARQAGQAGATGAATGAGSVEAPAGAVAPAPAVPRIDDARGIPGLTPGEIGNLELPAPATLPAQAPASGNPLPGSTRALPQNRVLSANAANANTASAKAGGTNAKAAQPTALSQGWLVDGMRQLEEEARRRGDPFGRQSGAADAGEKTLFGDDGAHTREPARERERERERERADSAQNAAADNPLAAFLDKWITTPEGAAAVRAIQLREGGGAANAGAAGAGGAGGAPAAAGNISQPASGAGANTGIFPGAGSGARADIGTAITAPAAPAGRNPYIDDLLQPQLETRGLNVVLPPPPLPPATSQAPATAAQPAPGSTGAGDSANSPPATPATGAPRPNPASKPAAPPPTAPVVDEKKYFPQLQRF